MERLHDILRAAYTTIRRRRVPSSEAEQGLKGGHGRLAAIVPKDELVQVNLELSAADAMVRADQPLLQVPHGAVGQRDDRCRALPQLDSERLRTRHVGEPSFVQARERFETICEGCRTRDDSVFEEGVQRGALEVRDHRHPKTPGHATPLLDRDYDEGRLPPLELTTPPQTRLSAPDPGLVDLHFAPQRFARHIDHGPSKLVEHHPRRFVPCQPQLALEKECRDTTLIRRHQVRSPEPERQRRLRVMEDRPGRQRDLVPACRTLPAPLFHHCVRPPVAAPRTQEAIRPATCRQILLTGFFTRELKLKLAQTRRKGRAGHTATLPVVVC